MNWIRVYDELNGHGYYPMDTLTAFIELFTRCEKQTTGAFMFRDIDGVGKRLL